MGQICGENIVDSKAVSIVNFRPKKNWREWNESPKAITNKFFATKDITVCFRYMTYMNEDLMVLVETFQIKIMFKKSVGYVFLRQWNATASNDEYRRFIQSCKPYEPGHWYSICIRVKLAGKNQEITYFQDGKKCFQMKFSDGNFEWLYLKKGLTYFEDLLR